MRKKKNYWVKDNTDVVVRREVYVPYKTKSRAGVEYTHYKKNYVAV